MSASKAKRILWTNSFWKWGKTTWVTYTLMMPIHALNEARKGEKLVGQHTMRVDNAHAPTRQKHVHVYLKNKQVFAMNSDSSAHDQRRGIQLSKSVVKALGEKLPHFKIPPNNFIESYSSAHMLLRMIDEALRAGN
jgi:hypothetical protein